VPFGRELWIERDDFMEDPPKKFHRMAVGQEVRLRFAYFVTCTGVIKDGQGNVVELRATYDPATRGGDSPDGRKVRGTIHWVSAAHAVDAEVRLYDHLFAAENPGGDDWREDINPDSLIVCDGAKLESSLAAALPGETVQFERVGYFCPDPDSMSARPVFNRTIGLRDSWAAQKKKGG
ncbi:MAG: glutamine--tRNA ligase, partial [Alphaproteobacteria bacterium]